LATIITRPSVTAADLARMRDQLVFDGDEAARKLSRFWVLLVLAAVIASAGVVGDSVAMVIGAMIVAPLMTPILGTVLSVVTGDSVNLAWSLGLVVAGAVTVVGIGWLFGQNVPGPVVADTNSQVAGRVHPQLIDLIAALATGAVGSFALVRSDVSDTLPGVAIASSLVPPAGGRRLAVGVRPRGRIVRRAPAVLKRWVRRSVTVGAGRKLLGRLSSQRFDAHHGEG